MNVKAAERLPFRLLEAIKVSDKLDNICFGEMIHTMTWQYPIRYALGSDTY